MWQRRNTLKYRNEALYTRQVNKRTEYSFIHSHIHSVIRSIIHSFIPECCEHAASLPPAGLTACSAGVSCSRQSRDGADSRICFAFLNCFASFASVAAKCRGIRRSKDQQFQMQHRLPCPSLPTPALGCAGRNEPRSWGLADFAKLESWLRSNIIFHWDYIFIAASDRRQQLAVV